MSDYLQNLAARVRPENPPLRPCLAARFEPLPGAEAAALEEIVESPLAITARKPGEEDAALPSIVRPVVARQPSRGTNQVEASNLERLPVVAPALVSSEAREDAAKVATPVSPQERGLAIEPSRERQEAVPAEPLATRRDAVPANTLAPRVTPLIERAPQREAAPVAVPEAPTVRVTIGRVEVRALMPPAPVAAPRQAAPHALSLEEYAKQRREGRR